MAQGNIASADLQWLLLKDNHSFLHKRVGAYRVFSSEKGNLRNIHAFKFSGLANDKSLDISANAANHGLVLTSRKAGASRFQLASGLEKKSVKGKSGRKAAGVVVRQSGSDAGRLDLRTDALARASAILASQRPRKALKSRTVRSKVVVVPAYVPAKKVKVAKVAAEEEQVAMDEAEDDDLPALV